MVGLHKQTVVINFSKQSLGFNGATEPILKSVLTNFKPSFTKLWLEFISD